MLNSPRGTLAGRFTFCSIGSLKWDIVAPLRVVGAAAVKLLTSPGGLTFDSKINNNSKVFFLNS